MAIHETYVKALNRKMICDRMQIRRGPHATHKFYFTLRPVRRQFVGGQHFC